MSYNVAIVGATGNVGREMLTILSERQFPVKEVFPLASRRSVGVEVSFGDKTLKCLLEVEPRFRLQMDDLSTLPDYAEFVKTEQYQEWLKRERK